MYRHVAAVSDVKLETLTSALHIGTSHPVPDMGLTATDDRTDVKPYFDTPPRELRDCIYDLLYQEIDESIGDTPGDFELHTRAFIPRLRFVSRQFKAEYDERISANELNQELTVTDDGGYLRQTLPKIICSPISSHTTRLTINMVYTDCLCMVSIWSAYSHPGSPEWLEKFTRQMPNLRQFRFRVCVPISNSVEPTLACTPSLWEYLPTMTELQVLSWDDITHAARPLGTCSKEHGMQRHEDAIAKHEARHRKIDKILKQERSGV